MTDQLVVQGPPDWQARTSLGAASDVLCALRGHSSRRPRVDPGLSGGLRDWLEDGIFSLPLDIASPLIVTKQTLRDTLAGRRSPPAPDQPVTTAMALGTLVDALFRQFVTMGHIDNPMADGLDALAVDPRRDAVFDFVRGLTGNELAEFKDELDTQSATLVSKWPRLAPGWLPRTQERIAVPLSGGRVVLVGIIDLMIGVPSAGQASVGLVEVKSGRARSEDREDLRFYALLETLRSGAAPFRLATFYTRTGELDAEDVEDELLAASVQRTIRAIARMARSR